MVSCWVVCQPPPSEFSRKFLVVFCGFCSDKRTDARAVRKFPGNFLWYSEHVVELNNRAPSEFSSIFLVVPRDCSVVERAGESSQNVPGTLFVV